MGNYHQVFKNFVGVPLLSPYQSEEIWREVYTHYGPEALSGAGDLRCRIGERLAGRPIRWLEDNPGPEPYRYAARFNAREIYLGHIHDGLKREAS
jgi:hypothetical protein